MAKSSVNWKCWFRMIEPLNAVLIAAWSFFDRGVLLPKSSFKFNGQLNRRTLMRRQRNSRNKRSGFTATGIDDSC